MNGIAERGHRTGREPRSIFQRLGHLNNTGVGQGLNTTHNTPELIGVI